MSRYPADRRRLLLRFLPALSILFLLAAPAMLVRAGRPYPKEPTDESEIDQRYLAAEARWLTSRPHPQGYMPLPENSPFGGALEVVRQPDDLAKGMLRSPLGDLAWDLESDPLIQR